MTAGGGATRFVGRERELEAILDAAAEALAGRSGTVLLEASSGMGATRLIDEVLGHLAVDPPAGAGAPVVIRADELPAWRRASYAPFRVALEGLLDERTDGDAMHVLGSGSELLLPLLPRAVARLAPAHPGPGTRERLPDRIHEAVRGVVCRLAAEQPVVVVVEDIHVLDAASRSLLAFLARTLGERPVLIVGSYQPEALGRGHPLRATVDAIASGPRPPRRVTLPPLDRAALGTLIAAHDGEAPSAPTLLLVAERSKGSPLVAEEVLVARRELSGASLSVPLEQMVVARAARRTPECRRVLRILAVAGGPLETARLGAVAAAYDAEVGRPAPRSSGAPHRAGGGLGGDLAAGVEEAVAHGFAAFVPAGPAAPRVGGARTAAAAPAGGRRLRVRHELVAAALSADLLPGSRRRMHAALGEALADRPEEASRHWSQAHETERELRSSVAAAAEAEQVGAATDALEHLERAISLAGAPGTAGTLSVLDELDLLARAAEASAAAGDAGRAQAFVESAIARHPDATDRAVRAQLTGRLGSYRLAGGDRDGAVAAFERALDLLPAGPGVERARLLATFAQVRMLEGAFSEATALAEDAIAAAEAMGPAARAWLGHATCTLGVVAGWLGRTDVAVPRLETALAIATELGGLDDAFRARANLTNVLDLQGRREEAVEVARKGIVEAERAGLEVVHGNLLRGNAVDVLLSMGRWAEARAMAERALEWAPSGTPFVNAAVGLAIIEVETSAGDAAARTLGHLFLELETIPDVQFAVPAYQAAASLALWRGDVADAVRAIDTAWIRVRDSEDWPNAARTAAALLGVADARARLARDRHDLADLASTRAWADAALRHATKLVDDAGVPPDAWVRQEVDADLATARAFAQRLRGHDDPATWAAVAARWRAVRRPYETARALHREVEAHLESGSVTGARREGREDARAPLQDAAAIGMSLGALPLLRALRDLAERARIPLDERALALLAKADEEAEAVASPRTPAATTEPGRARRRWSDTGREGYAAASFGLSPREQGVLAEIVAGRTNREIGERLFISEKTVGVHVGNILAKLGVGGRVEAATVALRLGLVRDVEQRTKKPGPGGPGSWTRRRGGAA
jgi:DNA-binding NarL/FixJ family response regulator